MMRFAAISLALVLTGCAAAPEPPRAAPASRAQQLAALLVETELSDPARLSAAGGEMAALEAALTRAPERAEPAPPNPPPAERPAAAPPAPDLSGARSVMSAVHLASYRRREHADPGWAQLVARHPELAGREARLSRASLGERGVFLRLKAGPFDTPAAAAAACDALKARGDWCSVTDFTGEAL